MLRSVWQSYWLYLNWNKSEDVFEQLEESVAKLSECFDDFLEMLKETGWNTDQINLKVPNDILFQEHHL